MIQNQYVVTKELYLKWTKENMHSPKTIIFTIFNCIFIFISLWGFLSFGIFKFLYFYFTLHFIYNTFFNWLVQSRKNYNRFAKEWGSDNWLFTVTFYDERFEIAERNITVTYDYKDVTKVKVYDDGITIQVKESAYIRIYNDSFTNGSREELISRLVSMSLL